MIDAAIGPACKPSFIKLVVPDPAEAVTFYREAFGMAVTETLDFESMSETFLELPETGFALVLLHRKQSAELVIGNGWGPLGFETDDLDRLLERVLAAGATIRIPPGTLDDLRYVIVESPQGHEIELIQRLPV